MDYEEKTYTLSIIPKETAETPLHKEYNRTAYRILMLQLELESEVWQLRLLGQTLNQLELQKERLEQASEVKKEEVEEKVEKGLIKRAISKLTFGKLNP